MPSGQGSDRQQMPQPLQGAPWGGFGGASGSIAITRMFMRTMLRPGAARRSPKQHPAGPPFRRPVVGSVQGFGARVAAVF
jgi:hypothetical protein